MRNNILTLLVGFVLLTGSILLVKLGLDRMTDAEASPVPEVAQFQVDMKRREILYRVAPGDTLWGLAERFYGAARRWPEIANANSLREGEGLISGRVIKIPLAADAVVPAALAPALPSATVDLPTEIEPRPLVGAPALGVTLCRIDAVRFPAGVLCVGRQAEDLSISLDVFDAAAEASAAPLAAYTAPAGDGLDNVFAHDADADGVQEIYSVWRRPDGALRSRVFTLRDGQLDLLCETPDDPVAVMQRRNANRK